MQAVPPDRPISLSAMSDAATSDWFGVSVAFHANSVVVGSQCDRVVGIHDGSAYFFERYAGGEDNWGQVKKIIAGDRAEHQRFGISVAIDANTVVVGADQMEATYIFNITHDTDGDNIADDVDNCPADPNSSQEDTNNDGIGDICDPLTDADGDNIVDALDNCPEFPNPGQEDADNDGIGDVCDPLNDTDGDNIADALDNCPAISNPAQEDADNDGIGDVCDPLNDTDGDNIADALDNCPAFFNPDQQDVDNDGIGDVCDPA